MNAPITNALYQWYRNGNLLSGEVSDTLMATQVGDYRLDVVISSTCTLSSNSLSVSELNCNRVRGDLRYDNNPQTPMAGVPVHLKTLLGNILMSDTTDSLGRYEMVGYPNGNYLLDAGVNYQWGGVNSSDALLVSRYFTSLLTLTPLRIRAGDVNGNGTTNSVDALSITRRSANIITAFAAGDFVNSRPSVVAGGNPIDMNLRVLSTGDVNGSYGVPVSTPVLVLDTVYSTFPTGTATVRFTTSGSGIFERGVCWGTSPSPTISQNKSIAGAGGFGFTHSFGGLTGGTLYYVRAYARNSSGTVYSNERSFTHATWGRCPGTPSVTDIDGNVYNTVQIGTQCWTQSNLKVSKYRNGDNIPTGLSDTAWQNTTAGAYAIYDNYPVNDGLYGKLYNHYAVMDTRGLCPTGWHVPTDGEWTTLETFLGGSSVAGGALKSTVTQPTPGGWNLPNTGATNSSGFSAEPGGLRVVNGDFSQVGIYGLWWSSSLSGANAWHRNLDYSNGNIQRTNNNRAYGFSVRCIRDSLVFGSAVIPTVTTSSATGITTNSATLGGDVTLGGGSTVTSRGVAYGLTSNPTTSGTITTDGSGVGTYVSTLIGLTPSTTYYVRAYATNGVGTAYGNEVTFSTTAARLATVTTTAVSSVTSSSATTGGNVTTDGGAAVTARGVAYGTTVSPTIPGTNTSNGTGTGAFTSQLTGLTASTTYYVRAYATNGVGTAYGNEISFSTNTSNGFSSCGGVTDVDGNSYQTVQIGTQCWTQSNLKVSKYRNGDNIPTGLSNSAWQNTTAGAYAIYDNNPVNDGLYGKLYNHYAVMDNRGLCPTGWHVPTDGEWTTLETYLGGSSVAGGALKSTTTQPTPGGWASPNVGATNSSGFSAGPGGVRFNGDFYLVGGGGYWWSSSLSGANAWNRGLVYDSVGINQGFLNRDIGISVRCLRD
jgi:uncharacterized protein (TIGR02145 family)